MEEKKSNNFDDKSQHIADIDDMLNIITPPSELIDTKIKSSFKDTIDTTNLNTSNNIRVSKEKVKLEENKKYNKIMKNINISNKAASPKQVRTYLRHKRGHAQEQDSRLLYSRPEIKPINFTNVSDLVECHECKKDVSLSAAINCTNFNCTKSYCLVCANKYPKEAFFNSCYFCKGICQCPSCVKNVFTGKDELVLVDKSLNFIDIRKSALDDDIIESLKPKKRNVQVIDIEGFEIIEDNQSQDSENFVEEIKEIPKDIDLSEDVTSSANMNNFPNKYHGINSCDNAKMKKKKKKQTQFSKKICSQFNNKGVANSIPSSIKEKTNNSIIIKIPNEKKLPFESESRINQILTRVCSNTALNPKYKTKKDCFICRQSNSISQYRFKCFTDFMVFLRQHFSINEYKSKSINNVHLAVNIDNLNQYYKQYFLAHYTESSQQYKSVKYICHNCLESKMFIENGFFELYNLMLLSNIKMDLFSKSSGLALNPNSLNNNTSKSPNNVNFYVNNIKKNDNNALINNNTVNNNTSNANNLNKTNIILNNNDANIINQITQQNLENSNLNIKPVVTTSTITNNTAISNNKNKVSNANKNEYNKMNNNTKETNKVTNINNAESNTINTNKVNETDFSIINNFNEIENPNKAPKEDTDMNNFNFSNNLNLAKDQESIEEQLKAIIIISQSLNLIKSKNDQPGAIQNFENELKEIIDQNPQLLNIIKTINEMYNSSKGHGNDLESQNQISESILMECLNNIGKDNGDTSFSNCLNILNQSNTNNNINNISNVNNHVDYNNNPKNYNYNNANSLDNDEVKKLFYLQNFSNTATTEKPLSNEEIDTSLQQNLQNLLLNSLNNDNLSKNNEAADFQTLQKLSAIRGLQEDSNRIEQIQKLLQYAQMSDINIDNNTLTQLIMSTMTENDNNMHNMNNNYGNMNDMNNLNNINFLNMLMNQAQYEQFNNQVSNVDYNDVNKYRENKEDNDNNSNNHFDNNSCRKNNDNSQNNNYSEKEIEDNKKNENNKSNSKEESINDIKVADESEDVRKDSNERKNSEEKKNESSSNINKTEDFNNINSMVLNNLLTNFQNNSTNSMNPSNSNPDILDNVYNNLLSMNSNKVENEQVLNSFFKGMLNEWTGANNAGPSEHIDKQEVEILKETSNSFFNNIFNQLSNSNNNIAHNNKNTTTSIREENDDASNNTNNNNDADKKDDSTNDFFKKNMCFILDELKKQFFSIQYFSLLQKLYTSYIFKNLELFVDNITKYHSLSEIVANNIMVLCTGKDPMLTDYSHYLRNITYIGSNLSNALSVNLNNLKFNGIKIFNSLENSLKSNLKTVIENFEDAYNIIQDDNKNINNQTNNHDDAENERIIDLENKDIEIGRSYTRIRNNNPKMEIEEENDMFSEKKSNISIKDKSENKPEIIIKDKINHSKMIIEEENNDNKDNSAEELNISNSQNENSNNVDKGDNDENEDLDNYDEDTINMVDLPEEFRDD